MLIQPRIDGAKRKSVSSRLLLEIERAVQNISNEYDVSKSYIIATHMADALGLKGLQVPYYELKHVETRKGNKRRSISKRSRAKASRTKRAA